MNNNKFTMVKNLSEEKNLEKYIYFLSLLIHSWLSENCG